MKRAFSLIELSIVILIIGILVAGVTSASRLVKQFRIKTAQTLTQSAPVTSIKDLSLWYETSMESSFKEADATDAAPVTAWYDINPQGLYKIHATQTTTTNQPAYEEDVINGLPVVRFDGNDNFMSFDGTFLAGVNYTIFVVEQRRATVAGFGIFIGGSGGGPANNNLHLGYRGDTAITQAHYSNDMDYGVPAYSSPTPRIHTFWFSSVSGKKYWMNGGTNPEQSDNAQTVPLAAFPNATLGRFTAGYFFNGDLAEIIIFSRDLKTEERQSVETYLSKKYKITIS